MNKKKLKIIQTPARFYPNIGGVNKYVLDLSKQLVKIGHEVKVFCADDPASKVTKIDGVLIERLKYIGKIANTNITPLLFFKLLKEDFDVLHTHIPTPWSADISMLVSIIKKKPLILTYHNDLIKNGIAKYIALIYNATLLKILFKKSKKIIITSSNYINHSNYLKDQIDKIVVIPNGVDLEEFKLDKNNKKVEYQLFFLSVLDIHHKYKGLDYLLYAMPDVIKQFPETKLLIGGKGELAKEYKKLAKELKISNNVVFLGYIKQDTLKDIYRRSSIFILPSIDSNEGFGIVLLEAMAYKTPVITTSITGVSDDIKKYKTGIVISPKNSEQLSESIVKLFKNKNLIKEMGNNGRKLVEKKYDWKKISKEIEKNYYYILS